MAGRRDMHAVHSFNCTSGLEELCHYGANSAPVHRRTASFPEEILAMREKGIRLENAAGLLAL